MTAKTDISEISQKVREGVRLSQADARHLWLNASDAELKALASQVRSRFHEPNVATYLIMRIINYTNVCVAKCDYCAFYRLPKAKDAYLLPNEAIFAKIDEILGLGGDLVAFNGGFNPNLKVDYYADLFSQIRSRYGNKIEFYAMTVVELLYVAQVSGLSVSQALSILKEAGVRWVTGGGAEILTDSFRLRHSPQKYTTAEYYAAQRAILDAGLNTTATMVIGFDETLDERLEHLETLRQFQDKLQAETERELFSFLLWTYKPYETDLGGQEISPNEYLRHLALCRIYLDNIRHVRTSVLTQNANALTGLAYGANDFDIPWEDEVTEKAGAIIERDINRILGYAREAGFEPKLRPCAQNSQLNPGALTGIHF
jgi:cyclic dehypoxanthinyl futalosine synthase